MTGLAFFDTNILIYADDASEPQKQSVAIDLIVEHQRRGLAVTSLQVLQEYFSVATKKLRINPEIAERKVQLLARGRVVCFEPTDVVRAIELHLLTRISFWDALIVQAARLSGALVLYSEDLQHGAVLGGVSVVNPFVT